MVRQTLKEEEGELLEEEEEGSEEVGAGGDHWRVPARKRIRCDKTYEYDRSVMLDVTCKDSSRGGLDVFRYLHGTKYLNGINVRGDTQYVNGTNVRGDTKYLNETNVRGDTQYLNGTNVQNVKLNSTCDESIMTDRKEELHNDVSIKQDTPPPPISHDESSMIDRKEKLHNNVSIKQDTAPPLKSPDQSRLLAAELTPDQCWIEGREVHVDQSRIHCGKAAVELLQIQDGHAVVDMPRMSLVQPNFNSSGKLILMFEEDINECYWRGGCPTK